jgi:hypothetical protein
MSGSATNEKRLAIYLNDHLAGSTLGLDLVKRTLGENRGTAFEALLENLAAEIGEDRRTLLRVMTRLGISPSRVKVAAAWAAERLGRLKLNGQLRGYSPLSRLVELEGLMLGIEGKRALWMALDELTDSRLAEFDFQQLAANARSQQDRLEPSRLEAAREALS